MKNLIGKTQQRTRAGLEVDYKKFTKELFIGRNYLIFDEFVTPEYKALYLILLRKTSDKNKVEIDKILSKLETAQGKAIGGSEILRHYHVLIHRNSDFQLRKIYDKWLTEGVGNVINVLKVYRIFNKVDYSEAPIIFTEDQINKIEKYANSK